MRTVRNHNSHAKEYSPQSSSSIRFSPRGDAFKHPVQHYDVAKVRSVSEVLEAFNATSFQSRKLGQSYKIWLKMLNDPERPMIFFGLSGAMIPGEMRRIIRDLIGFHAIDVLVSTGANLSHDLYESLGGRHYITHHNIDDPTLREMRIDRLYDTTADDVIFIGGGTPKNYIQQVVPMAEIAGWPVPPHAYAIQVTTDDPKFGGLSGCELPESQSWGKLHPNAEQCTVHVDATIGLPLLFTGIMEHYEEWKQRGPLNADWMEEAPTTPTRKGRRG